MILADSTGAISIYIEYTQKSMIEKVGVAEKDKVHFFIFRFLSNEKKK